MKQRGLQQTQRKRAAKFAAAALMAVGLMACSNGSGNETANEATSESSTQEAKATESEGGESQKGKTELSFYYWDANFSEEVQELIDGYTAEHAEVAIEATQLPWAEYWTKLETMLATGEAAPDLFWMNLAHFISYEPAGYLLALEDGVMETEQYAKTAIDLLKGDGDQYYAVPFLLDPNVMMYNKAMFDEAGLAYPTDDWTWEDFRTAAKTLTKEDGSQYGYCFRIDSGQGSIDEWLMSGGSDFFDWKNSKALFAEPEAVDAWEFLYEMMYQDGSVPSGAQLTEIQGDTYFQSGQAAMVFGAPPTIVNYADALGADKIGVAVIPAGKRDACSLSVCSISGYANTKHPKEVQDFLSYVASKEGMEILSKAGLTAYLDCFETYEQNLGIDATAIKTTLESSELIPILYSKEYNSEFQTKLYSCLSEIYLTQGLDRAGIEEITARYVAECDAMVGQ
ncbi:MAG: sugar ABC transporter substrate-binding protein [bacterium]|nr:sugar ABC transporter substrate-binding protein [bacterium]